MTEISVILLVAAVALVDETGRVLMQRRPLGKAHGGLWEFPGGKLEPGEAPDAAARREIAEELGLDLASASLEPVGFAHREGLPHLILLYLCRGWTGRPHCLEGEEIGWFAPADVPGLAMPPLDYPLARALLTRLQNDDS